MADSEPSAQAKRFAIQNCPRCGAEFDAPDWGRGRRAIWCSPRCRRLASAERVAARNAGQAVRVVEVPRAARRNPESTAAAPAPPPSMDTLAQLFLSSDYQCRMLLEDLERRYAENGFDGALQDAIERFAATVQRTRNLRADPDYRSAMADLERLRDRLQGQVDTAENRTESIDALRRELRAKDAQIARLSEALARLDAAHPPMPTPPDSGLSRQQRRAAERAARRTW